MPKVFKNGAWTHEPDKPTTERVYNHENMTWSEQPIEKVVEADKPELKVSKKTSSKKTSSKKK